MKLRWKIAQAAEIRWWKRYLKDKIPEEYRSAKSHYWKRILAELKPSLLPLGRTLDAGCGPAGIFMVLPDEEVTAIDPLLAQYERDLPHFSKSDYPWVNFECTSIEAFGATKPYDTIFCLNAINHVNAIDKSLDVLFENLKEGGQLIISTDAHKYSFLKKIFQWLPGDILHPHQYDTKEYTEMLTKRGGEIVRTITSKPGKIFDYVVFVVRV